MLIHSCCFIYATIRAAGHWWDWHRWRFLSRQVTFHVLSKWTTCRKSGRVVLHCTSFANVCCKSAPAKYMYTQLLMIKTYSISHWGRKTHICINKLTIICSDNGLSPRRRQAIIWPYAGLLLIGPLATNFSEILSKSYTFSFKKMHLKNVVWKMAAILSRPQCHILHISRSSVSRHYINDVKGKNRWYFEPKAPHGFPQ